MYTQIAILTLEKIEIPLVKFKNREPIIVIRIQIYILRMATLINKEILVKAQPR